VENILQTYLNDEPNEELAQDPDQNLQDLSASENPHPLVESSLISHEAFQSSEQDTETYAVDENLVDAYFAKLEERNLAKIDKADDISIKPE
jgi:hypothetical protein